MILRKECSASAACVETIVTLTGLRRSEQCARVPNPTTWMHLQVPMLASWLHSRRQCIYAGHYRRQGNCAGLSLQDLEDQPSVQALDWTGQDTPRGHEVMGKLKE